MKLGLPLVRHLVLEYPEDRNVWGVEMKYFFAKDPLIATFHNFCLRWSRIAFISRRVFGRAPIGYGYPFVRCNYTF